MNLPLDSMPRPMGGSHQIWSTVAAVITGAGFTFGIVGPDLSFVPWMILALLAGGLAVGSLYYFLRAHGLRTRRRARLNPFLIVIALAFGLLLPAVLRPLSENAEELWHLALGCVVIAALAVIPMHVVLRSQWHSLRRAEPRPLH